MKNSISFSGLFLTFLILTLSLTLNLSLSAQSNILSMRERAGFIDNILEKRVADIVPGLMEREGIDMWVIISREYNEDPVIKTFLPSTWLSARRRTILVFNYDKNTKKMESLAVARYDVGTIFQKAWNPESQPDQFQRLVEIIQERNPNKIALNYSTHFGLADGISSTDLRELEDALPNKFAKRITSAEKLALGWLETRIPEEMVVYRHICKIAHEIIAEAFSSKVITPGITTTDDVVWWMRERVRDLNLVTWFHPSVSIQRADPESFDHLRSFSKRPDLQVIMPGDLLHVDFGISYLRLNTDTQQHAYILRQGEEDAPDYLKKALKNGNELQDIFTGNFKVGKTGNQVLKESREMAITKGIKPSIYTHPIGYHGHAAGTTLGMWDQQEGVPHTGDYPLHAQTAYSIELNAATFIEEWGKEIRIMLEEDAFFDGNSVQYIDGRQKELLLIGK
ncbi:MAG: aminopeptidase P family protein [Cyclobacteriaceae bacterium]|nr:aminopeptidase P family protein [Cyclobacteriaceae bacterium]